LSKEDFLLLESEFVTIEVGIETSLIDFLVESSLADSRGAARRFLAENAIYLNGSQLPLDQSTFTEHDIIEGYSVVRRGKNTIALAKFTGR
jgi:tyrosyl-tRNA synthetase